MAFEKGNFDALTDIYAPIQVPLKKIQANPTVLKDFDEEFPIFNGLAANQNLGFDPEFLDIRSKKNVKAHWLQDEDGGDDSFGACDDGCEVPDADEVGAESIEYSPAECVSKGLKTVDQEKYQLKQVQEKVAFGVAAREFQTMRFEERRAIAAVNGFAETLTGMEVYGLGSVSGSSWNIASGDLGPESIYRFMQVAKDQRMIDPVLLTGITYEYEEMQFKGERGINLTKDANALLQPMIPIYRNRNHLDDVVGAQTMFLVDRATIGYFNQYHWQNERPEVKSYESTEHWVYNMSLSRLQWRNVIDGVPRVQNVKVDVRMALKCINEYENAIVHNFKLFSKWVQAPKGPNAYKTVIKITIT